MRKPCILKIAMEHRHGGLMVPPALMALARDTPPGPAREPSAQPGRWVSVNSDLLATTVQGDTHPRPTTEAGGATDNARLSSANLLSARARTPMAGACVRARHSGLLPILTLVTLNYFGRSVNTRRQVLRRTTTRCAKRTTCCGRAEHGLVYQSTSLLVLPALRLNRLIFARASF